MRRGRVVDARGNAVGGALVSIAWGTVAMPEIGRRTDENGVFQVGLPPGRFRLEAFARNAAGSVEIDGGAGEEIVIQRSSQ